MVEDPDRPPVSRTRRKRSVAILIVASPNPAILSQVAAFSLAIKRIEWVDWEPSIYLYLGEEPGYSLSEADEVYEQWRPHLVDVEVARISRERSDREGDWAHVYDAFRLAPRDADVLAKMDADTLPVRSFESALDFVHNANVVAGRMGNLPLPETFDPVSETWSSRLPNDHDELRATWTRVTEGLLQTPPAFGYPISLDTSGKWGLAPLYLNLGVVFFAQRAFGEIVGPYLDLLPGVEERMNERKGFAGQVALTLAITNAAVRTWIMPMRFNFPNAPDAERLYPVELKEVAIFHYHRCIYGYDRGQIFVSAETYRQFLELPLEGVHRAFQESVRNVFGSDYPFTR
jgi:hypothetical protein